MLLNRLKSFKSLVASVVICLVIISEWLPLSHRLLWFWWIASEVRGQLTGLMSVGVTVKISSNEKNPSAKKNNEKISRLFCRMSMCGRKYCCFTHGFQVGRGPQNVGNWTLDFLNLALFILSHENVRNEDVWQLRHLIARQSGWLQTYSSLPSFLFRQGFYTEGKLHNLKRI